MKKQFESERLWLILCAEGELKPFLFLKMTHPMQMNVLELRGSLVGLIAEVESEQVLRQIFTQSLKILRANDPELHFSPDLLAELEVAYAESDDESAAVSNEEAFKLFRQWAKK